MKQARIGYKFFFQGYSCFCRVCEYKKACLDNLEEGRIYSIAKVKNKKLSCELHGGEGRVVEVIEEPIEAAIKSRIAIPDALIDFDSIECESFTCKNYCKCNPSGLFDRDKCKMIEIVGVLDCPKGFSLSSVLLQRWS